MPKPIDIIPPVVAVQAWPSNAELIADVARCGYLHKNWTTLDVTYGEGVFWNIFRPRRLIAHDLYTLDGVDFRHLPERRNSVQVSVIDAPYRLTGTPRLGDMDRRFGVDKPMRWQDRHAMIREGISECIRVTRPGGFVLVKCMAQVAWHHVRWQDREFADHAEENGAVLIDRFEHVGSAKGYRAQPAGRPQRHARRNASTLLVFEVR